mgnify:CR=1 FL=1
MTDTPKYDWDWTGDLADDEDQVTLCADQLDRAKYAKFLTNYLAGFTESSYVMNLNAEWGAGKTYFLQRWHQTIKKHHPAAYVDAWKNDFSDDPLLTVISCILETLKRYPNVAADAYSKQAIKTSGRFLKQVAPTLIKGLFKTYAGVDSDSFNLDDFEDFAEKAMEASLLDHNNKSGDLYEFKKNIGKWLETSINSNGVNKPKKPMFVFIDELDRCRPTYAIELLETVKHLFDIPGLVFVVATNTDQLQHSIKAVYGSEFDAQRYLYRFFNRSFTLKKPDLDSFIYSQSIFHNHLSKVIKSSLNGMLLVENDEALAKNLAVIASSFDFDLRTTSQWLERLSSCYPLYSTNNSNKYFWVWLAVLIAIKLRSEELFYELFSKRISNKDYKLEENVDFRSRLLKILPENSKSNNRIEMSIDSEITEKYLSLSQCSGLEFYKAEYDVKPTSILRLSALLVHDNFSVKINKWQRKDVSTHPSTIDASEMAAYEFYSNGGRKQGYLDLVELASDLE